ncbi:restriction endonuclease subunit S [Metallibacterium sp.]|uniref:restriction endonuclease subunit S n=2 Tax=Metallibacterium sp. TaxID=2940281 RepID=UPI00261BE8BE|nr:restriction endonuclease subunit S [Metallibacterium sp.]
MWQATLGDVIASMKNGIYKPASEYAEDGIPCLRMYNIDAGQLVWRDIKRMRVSDDELAEFGLREGDLLVNRVNSRELVGKSTCIPASIEPSVFESKNIRVRLDDGKVLPKFINYQLLARGSRHFANNAQQVVGMASISQKQLASFPIVLANLDDQHRIVAEIEKQFSRLDQAVASLRHVKAQLKRYKASVLKAAVEGRLVETEAARARREGRGIETGAELAAQASANAARGRKPGAALPYETGEQLLQRILDTRRSQWNGKGKYKEPAAPDTAGLPELPEGWAWARLESIAALKGGITVDSKREDPTARAVPYLRVANVQRGYLDLSEVKTINAPDLDIEELRLQRGDILFNEGGDRDKLGRGWIWEGQLPNCIHQNHVFRARLVSPDILPKLVSWWGNSFGKDYFQREGKQTTNLASINLTKLRGFPVPLPPLSEQHRIVAEVDRRLSIVREVEAEVDANLKRAQTLRQAVLTRAFFSGPVAQEAV